MNKKLSILLAVLALIISTLACAMGEPSLSNVRTAKDQDGNQPASVFGTTDTIYVVGDLSNGVQGNIVSSKWYAVDVADTEPNLLIDEAEISIDEESFNGTIYFYFPPPQDGEWPVGLYKVEVYFDGALVSTTEFTVQ
jgi:hypothetical protein